VQQNDERKIQITFEEKDDTFDNKIILINNDNIEFLEYVSELGGDIVE
jgi:hypothetical protein